VVDFVEEEFTQLKDQIKKVGET